MPTHHQPSKYAAPPPGLACAALIGRPTTMYGDSPYDPEDGDWQTLATFFSPTEAYLLRGCLQAGGVPAVVADVHLVQTHSLLAGAIQVRVLVPERRVADAEAVMAAFQRGDFSLPDDENPPV